jgi:hypothetical protein
VPVPATRAPVDLRADRLQSSGFAETPIALGSTYHLFGGLALGRGLRFNNPYRLQTELGQDAQSLSLTAPYADLQLGAVIGGAGPVSHGLSIHTSVALAGIPQEVITPSYVWILRPGPRWAVVGRAGIPIVIEPDFNAGLEAAAGGVLYLTAGMGITASVVGSLFYGAATPDTSRTAIPLLSLEAGVVYDYEVLP